MKEFFEIDLEQPRAPAMLRGRFVRPTVWMKRVTGGMRPRELQDVVDDPSLKIHQRSIRYADHANATSARDTLLEIEELVRSMHAPRDQIAKMQEWNIGQMAEVPERQDRRDPGVYRADPLESRHRIVEYGIIDTFATALRAVALRVRRRHLL